MSLLKNYFLQIKICHQPLHNRTRVCSATHEILIISYLLRFLPSTTFSSFFRQKKCHVMFLFRPSASLLLHLRKPSINSFRKECEPRHRSCNASVAFDLYSLPCFLKVVRFELPDISFVVDVYGLLTKCEVKMARYWPSSFLACLWTKTRSRSINSQKKERGQYPVTLTEQAWSIKDLLYGFRGIFLRITAGSPERAR